MCDVGRKKARTHSPTAESWLTKFDQQCVNNELPMCPNNSEKQKSKVAEKLDQHCSLMCDLCLPHLSNRNLDLVETWNRGSIKGTSRNAEESMIMFHLFCVVSYLYETIFVLFAVSRMLFILGTSPFDFIVSMFLVHVF